MNEPTSIVLGCALVPSSWMTAILLIWCVTMTSLYVVRVIMDHVRLKRLRKAHYEDDRFWEG